MDDNLFLVIMCLSRSATRALIFVDINSMLNATLLSTTGVEGAEILALSGKSRSFKCNLPIFSSSVCESHRSQIIRSESVIWRSFSIPDDTEPSRISSTRFAPQLEQDTTPNIFPRDESDPGDQTAEEP